MGQLKITIGEKINRLTVKSLSNNKDKDGSNMCLFICDCGTEIELSYSKVKRENNKSCGCLKREVTGKLGESSRKYFFNQNAFDTITEESAYWLGFIMGDGCVSDRNTLSIGLNDRDKLHLKKFMKFMNHDGGMYYNKKTHINEVVLCSKILTKSLSQYNIFPRKTFTAKAPDNLKNDVNFWRGLIDADGSLGIYIEKRRNNRKYGVVSLAGTHDLCDQFLTFVSNNICSHNQVSKPHSNIFRVNFSYNKAKSIVEFLYENASTYLERKMKKKQDIMNLS